MPPSVASSGRRGIAFYDSDEDSSDEDDALHDSGNFFWDSEEDDAANEEDGTTSTGAASSSGDPGGSDGAGPSQSDPLLANFRTAWLDWGMQQSELERHFNMYPHEVKALRARCRALGWAPPAESTHGGPPPPKLPSRAELEQQWLDGDLPLRPVSDGLDVLAARLDVSVAQLRRHFGKIGFSPKHPMPRSEVKGVLDALLSRPWCNRLGPNFATTELRRVHSWDVRPALVRELLAELDPTGLRRRLKTHKRRKRPQYNVKGPRSLYHADAHEKLAHRYGFWFHGCMDGYSRFCVYLQARDNKRARTVRDIFVAGCDEGAGGAGWASRCRWDKGSENRDAIREQINRHYDPERPETGQRGSAITGVSMDNSRMEGFWRYVREQVTDQFYGCFHHMRTRREILNPADPCDLYILHTVFMPVVQRALDDMRAMWNEHPIRQRAHTPGHFGGIPSILFRETPQSVALRQCDDDEFYRTRGTLLEDGRDEDGCFGVEAARAVQVQEECRVESLHTLDPLHMSELLQCVRDTYLSQEPLLFGDTTFSGFEPYVREYIHYKTVCGELLAAYLGFAAGGDAVDWVSFGASQSPDPEAHSIGMRSSLGAIAQGLDAS